MGALGRRSASGSKISINARHTDAFPNIKEGGG